MFATEVLVQSRASFRSAVTPYWHTLSHGDSGMHWPSHDTKHLMANSLQTMAGLHWGRGEGRKQRGRAEKVARPGLHFAVAVFI